MTLATRTLDDAQPYPTPLFYAAALHGEGLALVFATDPATTHGQHIEAHPAAAAAVYLETEEVGRIEGVQLRGVVHILGPRDGALRDAYLHRHPVAASMLERGPARLFAFDVHWAKVTDNALGYGSHPTWHRPGTPGEAGRGARM